MRLARCSQGHLGLVTGQKQIRYPDGSEALAYTGWHLSLRLLGRRWSSRNPKFQQGEGGEQ